jgi:4-hydroxyphenylacetate 3-monooxygenase/4-hydroxybutyryl-CoA dehydratase/vinylacetyl-CoA-Delta-isomerase
MRTAEEYKKKIFSMKKNVYMDGECVGRDDPKLEPAINTVCLTYDAQTHSDEKIRDLATATSHLNGQTISRFAHMHRSVEDLLKKQEMTRVLCNKTGTCILRCMGIDALNGLCVATHEVDQKMGTEYHDRFLKYLAYFQENDLSSTCAQTDVKGNRKPISRRTPISMSGSWKKDRTVLWSRVPRPTSPWPPLPKRSLSSPPGS